MFFKFRRFFPTRKSRLGVRLSAEEIEILRRENLEAHREKMRLEGSDRSSGDKAIDDVSAPGVVTGMSAIVARTAEEPRARNKP